MDIPAVTMSAGVEQLPGLLVAVDPPAGAQGPGRDGGAGAGAEGGIGPGRGRGLDAGELGGAGTGGRQPGGPATQPMLIHETKPSYTDAAMRARVEGLVELDAVVLPDGSVGTVRIVRSLDPRFGLDQRAIDAVRQWRFRPAAVAGEPVAMMVRVELTFTLR